MRTRVLTSLLALSLATSLAGHANAQETEPRALERVSLTLAYSPQFQFAGYYAAVEKGFYSAEGLAVEVRAMGDTRSSALDAVLTGESEFGTATSELVLARTKGQPVVALAAILQHSARCIVSRRDAHIATPADLVGRRLALALNPRDAEVLAMLAREGIALDKIHAVSRSSKVADLVSGAVDAQLAYVTNEPDQLRRLGIEPAVMLPVNYGIDFYGDVLFTSERELAEHPARVAAFRRATLKGWDYAFEHPDEIVDLIIHRFGARFPQLTREHLRVESEAIAHLAVHGLVDTGHMNRGRWQRIADTYAELGMSPSGASLDGFIFDPERSESPRWLRWVFVGLAASVAIAGVSMLWARRLRQTVDRRTLELGRSEELFRTAFDSALIGCAMTSREGRFLRVNRSLCELLGYSSDELVGKHFQEITHPDDHALGAGIQQRMSSAAPTAVFEKRYLKKDRSTVWVLVAASRLREGTDAAIESIAQVYDLTLRKQSEDALRESELRFRTMADGAPVMIWLAREDSSFQFLSQRWLEFTGRRLEDEVGFGWTEHVHPQDRERVLAEHTAAFRSRRPLETEYRLRRADGEWRSILERATPSLLPDGTLVGFVGSCVDVSDRKHLEEQFLQSQKMEAIGRLAGGVAHDFNNLLAVIQGYSDLLMAQLDPKLAARASVEQIASAVEHAASLTRQLLALSRKQFLKPSVLDLNGVVAEMDSLLRRIIGEDVQLATTLSPTAGRVKVDRAQFEQVVLNLAVNARDAMPRGGTLSIETAPLDVDERAPRPPLAPGRWATLVLRDTGVGMDAPTLARIFEPFFTTKERGKGTGLGLSTVYGIVTQSGGHVEVTSEPGRGSCFRVCFPVALEEPEPALPTAPGEPPRGTETILLVEDDARVRRSTEAMLQIQGYRVLTAGDGAEALALLETAGQTVHLLVTDVVMPRMSGPELARRFAALQPEARVLFVSGYMDDRSVPEGGLPAGSAFLQKPFGLVALAERVRAVLNERTAPRTDPLTRTPSAPPERSPMH